MPPPVLMHRGERREKLAPVASCTTHGPKQGGLLSLQFALASLTPSPSLQHTAPGKRRKEGSQLLARTRIHRRPKQASPARGQRHR